MCLAALWYALASSLPYSPAMLLERASCHTLITLPRPEGTGRLPAQIPQRATVFSSIGRRPLAAHTPTVSGHRDRRPSSISARRDRHLPELGSFPLSNISPKKPPQPRRYSDGSQDTRDGASTDTAEPQLGGGSGDEESSVLLGDSGERRTRPQRTR